MYFARADGGGCGVTAAAAPAATLTLTASGFTVGTCVAGRTPLYLKNHTLAAG